MIKYTILIVLILFAIEKSIAQKQQKIIKSVSVSMFFGIRNENIDSLANTQNIDFMNYVGWHNAYTPDYLYMGIKSNIQFRNNISSSVKILLGDITGVDISAEFPANRFIGINAGYNIYRIFINDFSQFHENKYTSDFYANVEPNYKQVATSDNAFYAGVGLFQQKGIFSVKLYLNGGISFIKKFDEFVVQKKKQSNFKSEYKYHTSATFNPFFYPKASVAVELFNIKNSILGIEINSSWYVSKKSINYTQKYYEWTETAPTTELYIKSPKHYYSLFDLDGGIFINF